jgi:hypothetical protein
MAQTSITSYFNKRKRAGDEVRDRKKVFVVDRHDFAADVSLSKKVNVIGKALALDEPESLHTVHKGKSLIEHAPVDSANKIILENPKPFSRESEGKASEKHTDPKSSQGRKKETPSHVTKPSIQPKIPQVLLKTNTDEVHYKSQPLNGTAIHTSTEDGCVLVRYCIIEVDILNEILTHFVFHLSLLGISMTFLCKMMQNSEKNAVFE